jgi:hypothetical protein
MFSPEISLFLTHFLRFVTPCGSAPLNPFSRVVTTYIVTLQKKYFFPSKKVPDRTMGGNIIVLYSTCTCTVV